VSADDRRKGAVFAHELGSIIASGRPLGGEGGGVGGLHAVGERKRAEDEVDTVMHTRATPSPLSRVTPGSLLVWAGRKKNIPPKKIPLAPSLCGQVEKWCNGLYYVYLEE
jgi:hypothetical protein